MSLVIPVPVTLLQWVWLALGINFGRSFGKKTDQTIQNSEWFIKLKKWEQWIVERMLDATHHWWIGALLMVYCMQPELYWFGLGLLIDDLPDIPRRAKEVFADLRGSKDE